MPHDLTDLTVAITPDESVLALELRVPGTLVPDLLHCLLICAQLCEVVEYGKGSN